MEHLLDGPFPWDSDADEGSAHSAADDAVAEKQTPTPAHRQCRQTREDLRVGRDANDAAASVESTANAKFASGESLPETEPLRQRRPPKKIERVHQVDDCEFPLEEPAWVFSRTWAQ